MSPRRQKMTAADRAKKAAKRERRIGEAPQREAARAERSRERRKRAERLLRAQQAYLVSLHAPPSEVVCERCGYAQPYHHGSGVTKCMRGDLSGPGLRDGKVVHVDLECEGTVCVTTESWAEAA